MAQSTQDVSSSTEKPFPFLNLPAELRNQVYASVIEDIGVDKAEKIPEKDELGLFTTSRQVNHEFRSMYWCTRAAQVPLESLPAFVKTFASASHAVGEFECPSKVDILISATEHHVGANLDILPLMKIKAQMPNVKWEPKPVTGQAFSGSFTVLACEEIAKILNLGFLNLDGLLSLRYRCSKQPARRGLQYGGWWAGWWNWQVIVQGREGEDFQPLRDTILEYFHKVYLEDPSRMNIRVLITDDKCVVNAAYDIVRSGEIGALYLIKTRLAKNRRLDFG